jgi:hypothetical protein
VAARARHLEPRAVWFVQGARFSELVEVELCAYVSQHSHTLLEHDTPHHIQHTTHNTRAIQKIQKKQYEVGNQDHSLMLGVEAADAMLFGAYEATLHHPDAANARRNIELAYSDGRRPPLAPLAAADAAAGSGAGPPTAQAGGAERKAAARQ